MANPPFINSTGLISKILEAISTAQTPARFTQDFLGTKLGYASGSAKPIIPLLKRIGFLSNDGTPTELYSRFRSASERGAAMSEAMRLGFAELYERNEYVHDLPREKLRDLVIQVTGASKDNSIVPAIVGTFLALKEFADFDATAASPASDGRRRGDDLRVIEDVQYEDRTHERRQSPPPQDGGISMNLGYTINLNLPESTNPEVFNAIFKALRENLLKR